MLKLLQAIFCLFTFASLCFAGDTPNKPAPKKLDLGSLEKGLRQYLNFDGSLLALSPEGAETTLDFTRNSEAWTPNLEKAEAMEPRFMPGKFGQGILIEYGSCAPDADAGKNLLPTKTFTPLDGATLTSAEGPAGVACVKISGERPGISIETNKLTKAKNLNFSVYLKGDKGSNVTVGTTAVPLTGNWQRVEQNYASGLTIRSEKPFFAAAPMLEKLGSGYAGKSSASTWMPPFQTRPGDRLELPALTKTDSGTLSFWFKTVGKNKWRRLISFDKSGGWEPLLAVDLKDGQTMTIGKSKVKAPKPLDDDNWHQLVLRWEGKRAELFIDNMKNAEEKTPILTAPIHLGGTSNSGSPGLRADALFDEFIQWDRALSDAEIAKLNALPGPLGDGLLLPLRLHDLELVSVYPRDNIRRNWNVEMRNLGENKLDELTVAWGVDGVFRSSRKLAPMDGKSKTALSLEWSPALLLPGKYRFLVEVAGISYKKEIEISPARVPQENVQTIIWNGNNREYEELGVTTAGVGTVKGAEVAEANRNGLYSMVKVNIQGKADEEGDFMLGISGKPHNTDQRAPAALASLKFQAERLGEELSRFPDIRAMIINTEHLWVDGLDFREKSIKEAKEKFGLDLSKWVACQEKDRWKTALPGGRLAPSMGGITRPPEGILPLNDPLYSYMRWWHSGQAGNEIFLNDLVATTVRVHSPWVKSIVEPALRRPAVRAFKSQDILEEWFYYENPLTAISVQEKLTAAARGSGSKIAGMPQFLFKPGTAAPYMAMPAPHLFRETMWLCLSRPLRDFTFWGMWMALHPEKGAITQEEIDKELKQRLGGKEINFANVKAVVKTQGESSDFSLFIPELRDEIRHMLNDVVNPLGALLPNWRNRPRQIAVYISFAGQLHSEIRWPRPSTLLEALPYPYDVLYDQDFEDNPDLLRDYQVLILQECAAVTSVAAPQLERFAKRGGLLLADEWYKGGLNETVVINYGKSDPSVEKKLKARHDELISLYKYERHPQYIEGMEQAMTDVKTGAAPVAQAMAALRKRFAPEVEVSNGNVRFNTLTAAGANYLVAVNDLRTKGRFFVQYGRVLENGLPLDGVTFRMSRKPGKMAYELLSCRELSIKDAGDGSELSLNLPPAGGRIIVFLPEKIKEMRLNIPNESRRGQMISVKVELLGESGQTVPGIIPAKLELIRPDGSTDCFSHYCGIKDGRLTFELPIPLNSPVGVWKVNLRELASGKEASGMISVK